MIDSLRQYLLSIVAAALICALVNGLTKKGGYSATIIKLLSGIFLTLCVVSPIIRLDLSSVTDYFAVFSYDADVFIAEGYEWTDASMYKCIKEETEAYILDKAASMEAELTVEVTLSDDSPPVPKNIVLTGRVSPYAKSKLSQLIVDDLGIPKENQVWM